MGSTLRIGRNIADRLEALSISVLRIVDALPKEPGYRNVAQQLARAATACGANYEEARGAESRADFIHKLMLATKEARETAYWLRVIRGAGVVPRETADPVIDEVGQLTAILVSSANTARRNARA